MIWPTGCGPGPNRARAPSKMAAHTLHRPTRSPVASNTSTRAAGWRNRAGRSLTGNANAWQKGQSTYIVPSARMVEMVAGTAKPNHVERTLIIRMVHLLSGSTTPETRLSLESAALQILVRVGSGIHFPSSHFAKRMALSPFTHVTVVANTTCSRSGPPRSSVARGTFCHVRFYPVSHKQPSRNKILHFTYHIPRR